MEYQEFIKLVDRGASFPKDSIPMLEKFSAEFPFFQSAHALLAKAMYIQQDVRYDRQLKLASAYATDRKALNTLIHFKPTGVFAIAGNDSTFIIDNIETKKEILPAVEPQLIHDFDPSVIESLITEDVSDTVEIPEPFQSEGGLMSEDPHEVLKKRLEEILGTPAKNDFNIERQSPPVEDVITPTIGSISEQSQHEMIDLIQSDETNAEELIGAEIKDVDRIIEEIAEEKKEDIEELISNESEKAADTVQREQLEYALESAILDSLEKLPVIKENKNPERQELKVADKNPETPDGEIEKQSNFSFSDWLRKTSGTEFGFVEEIHADDRINEIHQEKTDELTDKSIEDTEVQTVDEKKAGETHKQTSQLIDKFIATEPRIVASKQEFYSPASQAKKSVTEDEDLITETLARIYYQQGNLLKARSAYVKLSLFHPEKKPYFAALISEIDAQYNNLNKQDL